LFLFLHLIGFPAGEMTVLPFAVNVLPPHSTVREVSA
jgi:hypothetical protein